MKASVAVTLNRPLLVETQVGVSVIPGGSDPATPGKLGVVGVDYKELKPKLLVFPPGKTKKYVTVTIQADTAVEANEVVTIALSGPVGASLGANPSGGVIIVNDD